MFSDHTILLTTLSLSTSFLQVQDSDPVLLLHYIHLKTIYIRDYMLHQNRSNVYQNNLFYFEIRQ